MTLDLPLPKITSEAPILETKDLGTEPLWTVDEVAQYLKLKPETIRTMARKGELPCLKLGKKLWRFKPVEVKTWLDTHQNN